MTWTGRVLSGVGRHYKPNLTKSFFMLSSHASVDIHNDSGKISKINTQSFPTITVHRKESIIMYMATIQSKFAFRSKPKNER